MKKQEEKSESRTDCDNQRPLIARRFLPGVRGVGAKGMSNIAFVGLIQFSHLFLFID